MACMLQVVVVSLWLILLAAGVVVALHLLAGPRQQSSIISTPMWLEAFSALHLAGIRQCDLAFLYLGLH